MARRGPENKNSSPNCGTSEICSDVATTIDNECDASTSDEDFMASLCSDSDESDSSFKGRFTRKRKMKSETTELSNNESDKAVDNSEVNHPVGRSNKRGRKRHSPPLIWEVWEEENERWLDIHADGEIDLESSEEKTLTETADPSSDVTASLLRFQKEWLVWALKKEQSETKGGILADEMGMGKTLQAISLAITARSFSGDSLEGFNHSSELPKVKCTLVICPVVAIIQWANEIKRFTAEGTANVLVYHGPQRGKYGLSQFSGYDFVLTTYSTVENDYRKFMMPPKQRCQWCRMLFLPEKLAIHQKYFCGPGAVRTAKQSKQVKKAKQARRKEKLSKSGVNDADKEHVQVKTDAKDHGKNAKETVMDQSNCIDATVYLEMHRKKSPLHSVKWERIILDEAHYIKDKRCNTARAVFSLESLYKWALSGTPLQNRVGELYSLVRFLQLLPFSYYFCKDCDCRTLDYSTSAKCRHCEHKSVRHFCWWNRYVASPIQKHGYGGYGRRAMVLLRKKLLHTVVLRRTKKGRAADLALPPKIVCVRRDSFDNKEKDFYEAVYSQSEAQFNTYVDAGTLMNNYAHIFDLLTRLRQAVDHPYLVIYSGTSIDGKDETHATQVCGICREEAEEAVVSACEHIFCKACVMDYSTIDGPISCPSCSKPLSIDFTTNKHGDGSNVATTVKGFRKSSILNKICLNNFQSSTKIEALREEIRFMIESDSSAKGIVFSQFTSFLDLINYSLQMSDVKCVQLVGSMNMSARDEAIKRFMEDPDCRIFLMSLKAGGVALNLTVASHVFLMDPWWNPAVEQQAQDRIHRIGQYKPIRSIRFVIEKTIEERILRLQEKKKLVFEGTVGGSSEALGKLTEADLRFLFQR